MAVNDSFGVEGGVLEDIQIVRRFSFLMCEYFGWYGTVQNTNFLYRIYIISLQNTDLIKKQNEMHSVQSVLTIWNRIYDPKHSQERSLSLF